MDEFLQTRLPLKIDDLVIRRIVSDDFDDLFEYRSDPDCARYSFWEPESAGQVIEMIDGQTNTEIDLPGITLILAVVFEGKVIGDCQLTITNPFDQQAELGFILNPKFSGRGLATRAVIYMLGIGFLQLGMHRIVGGSDIRNEPSWRLMERVGMRREAHFLQDNFVKGEWIDSFAYAMLADEWRDRHEALIPLISSENESA